MRHVPVAIAMVAGLSLAACIPLDNDRDDEPLELDRAQVTEALNARVGEHVDGVVTVVKSLERSERLRQLSSDAESVECPPAGPGMPPPACDVPPEPNRFDFTEQAADIKDWLNENVFTDAAVEKLQGYHWPGNVRELRNVIERAVALSTGPVLDAPDIWLSSLDVGGSGIHPSIFQPVSLEDVEKKQIIATLNHTDWNKSRTAEILGIERSTLDRKIKGYDLKRE